MSLIVWIVVGALAGWIASVITRSSTGIVTDIVIGMIGSIVGGALYILLKGGGLDFTTAFTNFDLTSILVSTLGAIVLLVILKALRKPAVA